VANTYSNKSKKINTEISDSSRNLIKEIDASEARNDVKLSDQIKNKLKGLKQLQ
jgi:hypothetical protein